MNAVHCPIPFRPSLAEHRGEALRSARLHDCKPRVPELFIYYRVSVRNANEARSMVLEWQRELGAGYPALHCRLLMRPEEREGLQTWMETYALADPGQCADADSLRQRIERGPAALQSWIVGERHVEVFVPCAW